MSQNQLIFSKLLKEFCPLIWICVIYFVSLFLWCYFSLNLCIFLVFCTRVSVKELGLLAKFYRSLGQVQSMQAALSSKLTCSVTWTAAIARKSSNEMIFINLRLSPYGLEMGTAPLVFSVDSRSTVMQLHLHVSQCIRHTHTHLSCFLPQYTR